MRSTVCVCVLERLLLLGMITTPAAQDHKKVAEPRDVWVSMMKINGSQAKLRQEITQQIWYQVKRSAGLGGKGGAATVPVLLRTQKVPSSHRKSVLLWEYICLLGLGANNFQLYPIWDTWVDMFQNDLKGRNWHHLMAILGEWSSTIWIWALQV